MPLIDPVKLPDVSGTAKEILEEIKSNLGKIPNIYATMANSPSTLAATMAFSKHVGGTSLDPLLCEKIALVVGNENSCQYCVSAHSAIAAGMGLSDREIIEAQKGNSEDPREQAILTLAISLNGNHGHGDNSAVQGAIDAGVSKVEILEVLAQVLKNIITNTFNGIAETEIDFPVRELI